MSASRRWILLGLALVLGASAGLGGQVTSATTAAIRDAAARTPQSVRLAQALRAYFAKAREVLLHLDGNPAGLEVRDGQLLLANGAASDRYNALLDELQALAQMLDGIRKGL